MFLYMLNIEKFPKYLMSTLSSKVEEAREKEQHVCKLHRYISNIPKRDNTCFFFKFTVMMYAIKKVVAAYCKIILTYEKY